MTFFLNETIILFTTNERIHPSTPTFCTTVQKIPDTTRHFQYSIGYIKHLFVYADCSYLANLVQDARSRLQFHSMEC